MVACISPDIGNCEQTLNTLRYADRVKERNPESGVLSTPCQLTTRKNSSQSFKSMSKSFSDASHKNVITNQDSRAEKCENNVPAIPANKTFHANRETQGKSDTLRPNLPAGKVFNKENVSEKQKAGHALVSNHRAVMSEWLAVVKNEMNLVNQVDADRDGLDDYLLELQNLQRTQIGFISELRSSLQKYVHAAESPMQPAVDQDDDDSFEDLRD